MDGRTGTALRWLLQSEEPAVRCLARRDLLGEPVEVVPGPWVSALLDGGLDGNPYRKWTGAHWRLISLAELGAPPDDPRVRALADRVLTWLTNPAFRKIRVVDGLARRCGSIEGYALAALCRLGHADDPRTALVAESLLTCQWPDGGWNCDVRGTRRSSFHETAGPMYGLFLYGRRPTAASGAADPVAGSRAAAGGVGPVASGAGTAADSRAVVGSAASGAGAAAEAAAAAGRAAELLLEHRLFRSLGTGDVINRRWLDLRYPPYWHYDILQALLLLSRMGRAHDPRTADALDEVERRRLPDGRWRANGSWWKPADSRLTPDVVDWGRTGPNSMVTLNALRVLHASGRIDVTAPDVVGAA
jgi:hypothetical protein